MAIAHLLNQLVTIYSQSAGVDKHGNVTFSSGSAVLGRFQRTNKTIVTDTKEIEPIDGIVFLSADVTVEVGDKLTYAGEAYRVMKRSSHIVGNGRLHHTELMVQLWGYGA